MAVYFFDSSAVVKRYLVEAGSTWVRDLGSPDRDNIFYIARITGVEAVSAIARRQRGGSLTSSTAQKLITKLRRDLQTDYSFIETTVRLLTKAMDLAEVHALRGYDAVQLAASLQLSVRRRTKGFSAITLVSADAELNFAAAAEGLVTDDPNAHS